MSHPWPEFHALLDSLSDRHGGGGFNRLRAEDAYVSGAELPEDFVRAASACLSFARDRPNLLRMVSRRDVEVIVESGTPFLFKNGDESVRRMKSFVRNEVSDFDEPNTVDLMKFLLSYASDLAASLEVDNLYNRELVESSVRNLLGELAKLSYGTPASNSSSVQNQFPDRYGQMQRTSAQNIQMKRGDWICPRCSFMNFARNVKCLKCDEARPKRQLTGGEWECPQCDFFNHARNMECLRCDCKRPGESSYATADSRSGSGYGYGSAIKDDIDSRSTADKEKEQRWFSKVSQLDNTSDLSSIADEDFPEIMPLRKGVNRFVVSTRKTPLERRLANAEYRRNLGNDGMPEGDDVQTRAVDETPDKKVSRNLDELFGRSSTSPESNNDSITTDQNASADSSSPFSSAGSSRYPRGNNSNYVPFVPLPADMFAEKTENAKVDERMYAESENYPSDASDTSEQTGAVCRAREFHNSVDHLRLSEKPVSQMETKPKENEQADKPERWFKRVAEVENFDVTSAISDDFSEIMPMRKGENRFVVNKKKDRSLTSPMYRTRVAMEQANNTNFVPFVPFPPDYFAKKDRQEPVGADSTAKAAGESSNSLMPEKLNDARPAVPDMNGVQQMENQQLGSGRWNSKSSGENVEGMKTGSSAHETCINANSTGKNFNSPPTNNKNWSSGYSGKEMTNSAWNSNQPAENQSSGYSTKENTNFATSPSQPAENQNVRSSWTGKSLEGSAVKELDPLDMSEEAKAERWFRRVAQIKDISELSQIPDEDFPSIMPMRKGVNRFVVSKRKTPLERRLTSQQYRRNLPIVSSEPVKKESDSSRENTEDFNSGIV